MSAGDSVDDDLHWCERALHEWLGVPPVVDEIRGVPSRLGIVRRLTIAASGRTLHVYLKRYGDEAVEAPLLEHFLRLQAISSALQGADALMPYTVIGADGPRRLLLTAEMQGQSLASAHLPWMIQSVGRQTALRAWRGVGQWLAALHWRTLPTITSTDQPRKLVEYTRVRFQAWAETDRVSAATAARAITALETLGDRLRDTTVLLTPCHGDVTGGNIIWNDGRVGMLDLDDLHFDLPALDLSQALIEAAEFGRLGAVVPVGRFATRAREALEQGYGRRFPEGPEFWLPHLRNLAVVLLTIARARGGVSIGRFMSERRYGRTIAELHRTLAQVETGKPGSEQPQSR